MSNFPPLEAVDYERAAEIITPETWRTGTEGFSTARGHINDEGRYCYFGALKKAHWERTQTTYDDLRDESADHVSQARKTWREVHNTQIGTPWDWNDEKAMSAEEVSIKLMEVGKFLRDKGERISE